jgi:pSer/pThr/pTyr-binding forkhead associated (FHA) protein
MGDSQLMPPGQQGQQAAQQAARLAQQQVQAAQLAQQQIQQAHEQLQRRARGQRAGNATDSAGRAPASPAARDEGAGRELVVVSGSGSRRPLPVPAGGLTLGRLDELGPPLSADALVSRTHARATLCADGSVEVTDLGSTNGTFVNGRQITTPVRMRVNDVLRVGDVELRLRPSRSGSASYQDTRLSFQDTRFGSPDMGLLAEARDLYEQFRYEEARSVFLRLAGMPTMAAEGRFGLGMIALSEDDPAEAEAQFRWAVELDPGHANALYEIGALEADADRPDAALAFYDRALATSPQHASALAGRDRLAGRTRPLAPHQGPAAPVQGSPPPPVRPPMSMQPVPLGLPGDNIPSVYQFLLEDPTPISQQTVQLIQRVEYNARPRYLAYVGRYFARTIVTTVILAVVVIAVTIVLNVLGSHYRAIPSSQTINRVTDFLLICIAALPVCTAIIGYINVQCTHIRIQKARLQIEKGIIRKHLNNIDFWRVHNIDLDRRLINRMTGDGTLVFSLTFGVLPENYGRRRHRKRTDHVVEVCGLVRGAELTELYQDLLNLTFLLRGNPIVKGIIQ